MRTCTDSLNLQSNAVIVETTDGTCDYRDLADAHLVHMIRKITPTITMTWRTGIDNQCTAARMSVRTCECREGCNAP